MYCDLCYGDNPWIVLKVHFNLARWSDIESTLTRVLCGFSLLFYLTPIIFCKVFEFIEGFEEFFFVEFRSLIRMSPFHRGDNTPGSVNCPASPYPGNCLLISNLFNYGDRAAHVHIIWTYQNGRDG